MLHKPSTHPNGDEFNTTISVDVSATGRHGQSTIPFVGLFSELCIPCQVCVVVVMSYMYIVFVVVCLSDVPCIQTPDVSWDLCVGVGRLGWMPGVRSNDWPGRVLIWQCCDRTWFRTRECVVGVAANIYHKQTGKVNHHNAGPLC